MILKLVKITKSSHRSAAKRSLKYDTQSHQCCVCKKVGIWERGWQWYGSYVNLEDGDEIFKTCSGKCRKILQVYAKQNRQTKRLKNIRLQIGE